MKAEHKRQWVEALRSGQYKQGRGWLKVSQTDGLKYCCLGVACELFKGVARLSEAPHIDNQNVYLFNGSPTNLHFDTARAIGLPVHLTVNLIRLNDSEEWTFHQIADWIEEHVPTDPEAETTTTEAGTVRHPNT